MYWHNNLLCIKATYSFLPKISDVISISSNVLENDENGIVVYSSLYRVASVTYSYTYINNIFNETIINNMKNSSGNITIKNLNVYSNNTELYNNFNKHNISKAYEMINDGVTLTIKPKINNETVYYNMEYSALVNSNGVNTYNSTYSSTFTSFKYTPFYSILNILGDIKEDGVNVFNPLYSFDMAVNTGLLLDNNNVNISDYELIFNGTSHKSMFDSYLIYTFTDVIIYDISNNILETYNKLLILDKSESNSRYTIRFNKKIVLPNNAHHIDFNSRNKLSDISSDLNELNNIQTNKNTNSIGRIDFNNEIPFQINTESYYNVLYSDYYIQKYISAICYTNNSNILSLSVVNNDYKYNYKIQNLEPYTTRDINCSLTTPYFGATTSQTSSFTNYLIINDSIANNVGTSSYIQMYNSSTSSIYINMPYSYTSSYTLEFDVTNIVDASIRLDSGTYTYTYNSIGTHRETIVNATYSKFTINTVGTNSIIEIDNVRIGNEYCIIDPQYTKLNIVGTHSFKKDSYITLNINSTASTYYNEYVTIDEVISESSVVFYKNYINSHSFSGTISTYKSDPYLNFLPTDITKVGTDKKINIFSKINESDLVLIDYIQSVQKGLNKNKYRLIDGLTINDIYNKYKWLLEAEIEDAVIGEDANGLVWYSGKWFFGRWFGSNWYSGEWHNGEWYSGNMYGKNVEIIGDVVNIREFDANKTIWYSGNFHNGQIYNISWLGGNMYNGTIEKTDWLGGSFHYGTMSNVNFKSGNFINGNFINGNMNEDYGTTNFMNGTFIDSIFECGNWYNGTMKEDIGKSYFGYNTSNIKGANFIKGNILSGVIGNANNNNTNINSANISYADLINCNINNVDLKNGTVKNTTLNYINIVALNLYNTSQYIVIDGIYDFNINYKIYILDDSYKYNELTVSDYPYTINDSYTVVPVVNTNLNINIGFTDNIVGLDNIIYEKTLYKMVSYIKNVKWTGGVFNNGIFDGEIFKGLFKDGVIKSGKVGN